MTELVRIPHHTVPVAALRAIRTSANQMAADEEQFVRLLHQDIANLLRQLPDGGQGFCERTARTVFWLAASEHSADAAIDALQWLATANQADGFPESEYVSVGHALVRVVRDMSGMDWTSAMGSAWIRFFMWMQPHLRSGAQQAAARQEAIRKEAARREAARQEAARSQAAEERDAARRQALEHAKRQRVAEAFASAVASLFDEEDEKGKEGNPGYRRTVLGIIARHIPAQRRPTPHE